MAAKTVMFGSLAEAEQDLRVAGFVPLEDSYGDLPAAEAISDVDEEIAEVSNLDSTSPSSDDDKDHENLEHDNTPQLESKSDSTEKLRIGQSNNDGYQSDCQSANDSSDLHDTSEETVPKSNAGSNPSKPGLGGNASDQNNEPSLHRHSGGNNYTRSGGKNERRSNSGRQTRPNQTKRQERNSRMLAYVNAISRNEDGALGNSLRENNSNSIDMAAISAALKYEENAGRVPIEQPYNNPGYDINSSNADGSERRLIKVKGLNAQWNEWGVKLAHVQFAMAQLHPEEY